MQVSSRAQLGCPAPEKVPALCRGSGGCNSDHTAVPGTHRALAGRGCRGGVREKQLEAAPGGTEPTPGQMDLALAKAEPMSHGGNSSGITD